MKHVHKTKKCLTAVLAICGLFVTSPRLYSEDCNSDLTEFDNKGWKPGKHTGVTCANQCATVVSGSSCTDVASDDPVPPDTVWRCVTVTYNTGLHCDPDNDCTTTPYTAS